MNQEGIQIEEHEELLNPMIDPIFKALFTSDNAKPDDIGIMGNIFQLRK